MRNLRLKKKAKLGAAVAFTLLLSAVAALASFPGIAYDLFCDFEATTNGSSPTVTQLANSSHGATGTWTNDITALLAESASQCPLSGMGDSGALGLQYSSSTGAISAEDYTLPVSQTNYSVGACFESANTSGCTGSYVNAEGPHFLDWYNASLGDMERLADECNSNDNTREVRISPCPATTTTCRVAISDSTFYWVTFQFDETNVETLKVYNIASGSIGSLVGTATYTGASGSPATDIFIGNAQAASPSISWTDSTDDVILSSTFPVLPVGGAAACQHAMTLLHAGC